MNSYPKLFYILKEINLFDKTNLVDELNSILKQKNVTKPEIIDYFKKPYLKWFVSPTDDQEKQHYVKKHHISSGDPEWAKNTFDFNHLSTEHKEELAHTIDFFNQLNERDLKKIHKIPFPTVRELVKKWDQDLAKRMDSSIHHFKIGKDVEILKQWPNGYKIVKILSDEARKEEGDIMGHCVGGDYYRNETILSLRDEHAMPHVTMEVDRDNNIVQIKGKQNAAPVDKYVPYIKEFINESDLEIGGDGENIGYHKWSGKYYDPDGREWRKVYNDKIVPMQRRTFLEVKERIHNGVYAYPLHMDGIFLEELPEFFKGLEIQGVFNISTNNFKVLKNMPSVCDSFIVNRNKLVSLVGGPETVLDGYRCSENKLTSLEGICKNKLNGLFADGNKLTNFEGIPEVSNIISIGRNNITSLEPLKKRTLQGLYFPRNKVKTLHGSPLKIKVDFIADDNNELFSLEGGPEYVGGFYSLEGCPNIRSLKGFPKRISGNVWIDKNLEIFKEIGDIKSYLMSHYQIGGSIILK